MGGTVVEKDNQEISKGSRESCRLDYLSFLTLFHLGKEAYLVTVFTQRNLSQNGKEMALAKVAILCTNAPKSPFLKLLCIEISLSNFSLTAKYYQSKSKLRLNFFG